VGEIPDEAPSGAVADTLSAARAAIEAGQEALTRPVGGTIHAARQVIGRAGRALGRDTAARRRRIAGQAREPLAMLYEVHPEARRALPHALGLRVIPVDRIAGSAVEPPQRGGDFLPLRQMRTANWRSRWQRLRQANERLAQLPPIDVFRFGDRYWVTDGHNRVALALLEDQPEIDANVVDLHLPGTRPSHAGALAPLLEETREAGAAVFPRRAVSVTAPPSDLTSGPTAGGPDAGTSDGGSEPGT
jgi:hypothetical protein